MRAFRQAVVVGQWAVLVRGVRYWVFNLYFVCRLGKYNNGKVFFFGNCSVLKMEG